VRMSHSKGFMKQFNEANIKPPIKPMESLPSLVLNTVTLQVAEPNPLEKLDFGEESKQNNQESLEERRLRLEARREAIQAKKRQEEEAKALANRGEERKRDTGDIFRNTQMKFNESPEQKKLRMKRALIALHKADIGKPSAFVGM